MDIKRKLGWQSYKLDFKPKTVIRDEEGHYIIIKGSIQQENLTIVNIYALNIGAAYKSINISQYMSIICQIITKLKKHTNNNIIIIGDFNTIS